MIKKIFIYAGLYLLGGRAAGIFAAFLMDINMFIIFISAFLIDEFQLIIFEFFSDYASRISLIKYFARRRDKVLKTKLFSKLLPLKYAGIYIITLSPLRGCGVLSGFLMSKTLKINKIKMFFLLTAGNLTGIIILIILIKTGIKAVAL